MRQTNGVQPTPEPQPATQVQKLWDGIDDRFQQVAQLWSAIRRPLPTHTQDGTYVDHEIPRNTITNLAQIKAAEAEALVEVGEQMLRDRRWNDRKYQLEALVAIASHLKPHSRLSNDLTNNIIGFLWKDLAHPPQAYLGRQIDMFPAVGRFEPPHKFQYRTANGAGNSLHFPELGAAGTPYARSVKPTTSQNIALPDPGVVFDTLFARTVEEKHENKISSFLFHFATIIIHDLFRTSHKDSTISETSSYLDLAPLYGSNSDEQRLMRTFEDGKIKPDCFSEKRILGFPPGVGAILIMFNRFHNYAVENLAQINENGRFTKPAKNAPKKDFVNYDEELFQTGRLVTCGLYINIILADYIRSIVNLNRTDSKWFIDPRNDIHGGPPLGTGNQVSCEFNLIYRWHSTMSTEDAKYTETLFEQMFPDREYSDISAHELIQALSGMEKDLSDDPLKRPFSTLERGKDGTYSDDDLVQIVSKSIEDCAHSFGARRVPKVMRSIEILGILQARRWNVATLNEFRKHFGLTQYKNFEEMNPDPEVAAQLKHLYTTIDQVELYPGLVCESAKDAILPGSGLMPGFTVSRAILSDAIALVRGDRFFTTEYHPKNLTNWGFAEIHNDPAINNGCVFYKLFFNAFPDHFDYNSVYAHWPTTIPSEMRNVLQRLDKEHRYTYEPPMRRSPTVNVSSYNAIRQIMNDKCHFHVTWGPAMEYLMGKPARSFMLAGDGPANLKSRAIMHEAIYVNNWMSDVQSFYESKTRQLLREKSYSIGDARHVDMIRDVTNMVHVHFCAEMFRIPLKDEAHPREIFTENELYLILVAVFTCIFFDLDPRQSFPIHQLAYKATHQLGDLYEKEVGLIKSLVIGSSLYQQYIDRNEASPLRGYGVHMIRGLLAAHPDLSVHELVWGHILGTAGGMVPNQGQIFGQVLDYYFGEGAEHWPEIVRVAADDSPESFETLKRYLLEGSRLNCGSAVMRWATHDVTVHDGSKTLQLKQGDKIFCDIAAASRDPSIFPNPYELDLNRDLDAYVQFGQGPHMCLGKPMTELALTTMLREIARLPNLKPLPGLQGTVKKVPGGKLGEIGADYAKYMTEDWGTYFPFPTSMKFMWDEEDGASALEAASYAKSSVEVNGVQPNGVILNGGTDSVASDADSADDNKTASSQAKTNGKAKRNTSGNKAGKVRNEGRSSKRRRVH